jgi:hypothetical protein
LGNMNHICCINMRILTDFLGMCAKFLRIFFYTISLIWFGCQFLRILKRQK